MARNVYDRRRDGSGELSFNMTPMIDCTFQLIIFFILASQIASRSLAELSLPRPHHSQAIPTEQVETPNNVVVNVISAADEDEQSEYENPALAGRAERYEIDGMPVEVGDVDRLVDILARRKASSGVADFQVEVRADYRVSFSDVQPVMVAAGRAGIVKMNITALTALEE